MRIGDEPGVPVNRKHREDFVEQDREGVRKVCGLYRDGAVHRPFAGRKQDSFFINTKKMLSLIIKPGNCNFFIQT